MKYITFALNDAISTYQTHTDNKYTITILHNKMTAVLARSECNSIMNCSLSPYGGAYQL